MTHCSIVLRRCLPAQSPPGGFQSRFSEQLQSRQLPLRTRGQLPRRHLSTVVFLHGNNNKTPARAPTAARQGTPAGVSTTGCFSWCPVAAIPGLFCASQSASVCLRPQLAMMPMPRATPLGIWHTQRLFRIPVQCTHLFFTQSVEVFRDSLEYIPGQAPCLAYVLHWPTSLCMYACVQLIVSFSSLNTMKGTLVIITSDSSYGELAIQLMMMRSFRVSSSTGFRQIIFCMPIFRRLMMGSHSSLHSVACVRVLNLATQTEHHRDD